MMHRSPFRSLVGALLLGLAAPALLAAPGNDLAAFVRDSYRKLEVRIPMRDGARLFTAIYMPRDSSRTYPFLMIRTPYSAGPYGRDAFPGSLGPSEQLARERFIFVYQDVRGRFMSEGTFVNMTPHIDDKQGPHDVDESSDTYDTISWLIEKIPNNNGRVGMWGISYPGFYAAASMIDAHPALRAVSPQAPISDWFFDDFHHHGAFFLPDAFNFFAWFGPARPEPTTEWPSRFRHGTPDGYQFFLELGPLGNVNQRYFKGKIEFWNRLVEHPNYDAFWRKRNILPHLHNVAPAVMTVGGWFDAEDLRGPLHIYPSIEEKNPGIVNVLVEGPWRHGGWGRTEGDHLGNVSFGSKTSLHYREKIEAVFFNHFLKDQGTFDLPEATVFETGVNRWRRFDEWPPVARVPRRLYLRENGSLSFEAPITEGEAHDEFISDPARPVPFCERISVHTPPEYMTDDQRFAARRPDVLVYQTAPLVRSLTSAGPLTAHLWVTTTGTDADWIVKLIDVFPGNTPNHDQVEPGRQMGGYQMMVRSEVIRGRFRNGYEKPEPFVPGQATRIDLPLQDILHTFGVGHRIMVQIQSSWFPMVDRNPQKFVPNIFEAGAADFIPARHRVLRNATHASSLELGVLP